MDIPKWLDIDDLEEFWSDDNNLNDFDKVALWEMAQEDINMLIRVMKDDK